MRPLCPPSLPHSFMEASVGWAPTACQALGVQVTGQVLTRGLRPGGRERWKIRERAQGALGQKELHACGLRVVLGRGMSPQEARPCGTSECSLIWK